ncbi:IRF tryptophan pentad repeat domain-containing protein [Caerostris extrusa]|uniref:IRF tryptophan pentad repeat domain-containing protein n=1 Tax=Caerostris extrusa TaxID=172846 RepID=A0AAV4VZ24_CAEEX|nr:IRF tryptophan pentad repeat domain-containing protein [Caerostris extrusa]
MFHPWYRHIDLSCSISGTLPFRHTDLSFPSLAKAYRFIVSIPGIDIPIYRIHPWYKHVDLSCPSLVQTYRFSVHSVRSSKFFVLWNFVHGLFSVFFFKQFETMPTKGRKFITEFLIPSLNTQKFGSKLMWLDGEHQIFQMQWNHKSASDWTTSDAAVLQAKSKTTEENTNNEISLNMLNSGNLVNSYSFVCDDVIDEDQVDDTLNLINYIKEDHANEKEQIQNTAEDNENYVKYTEIPMDTLHDDLSTTLIEERENCVHEFSVCPAEEKFIDLPFLEYLCGENGQMDKINNDKHPLNKTSQCNLKKNTFK